MPSEDTSRHSRRDEIPEPGPVVYPWLVVNAFSRRLIGSYLTEEQALTIAERFTDETGATHRAERAA